LKPELYQQNRELYHILAGLEQVFEAIFLRWPSAGGTYRHQRIR